MQLRVYLKTLCEYARFQVTPSSGIRCVDRYTRC
jgi:hypothetical protein